MDLGIYHIQLAQKNMILALAGIYAEEYHLATAAGPNYDNNRFREDIAAEQNMRRGASSVQASSSSERGCTIACSESPGFLGDNLPHSMR